MPFTMEWMQENRVIYQRIWGEMTLEDIQQLSNEHRKYLDEGTPLVHSIVNNHGIESYPKNLGQLREALELSRHPSVGWTIIVGPSSAINRFFTAMVNQLINPKGRFNMFNTMEEAVAFLEHRDVTVDIPKEKYA